MPSEVKDQWSRWLQDVPLIQNLDVPRCLKPEGFEVESAELHHFADASEHGYGAVSYLRLVDTTGTPHCSFLMSKSRLAPLKSTTIPRLELAAAVEAVKLDKLLCKELQMSLQTSFYWSDSMIVLWYLQQEDKRYQTYVANRVAVIQEHSTPIAWILRFKQYLSHKKPLSGELTVMELPAATTALIVYVQSQTFRKTKDNSLQKLSPFQSEDGTWRVGGRLNKAEMHFQTKHPWILPAKHHITDLVIRHYHAMNGHAGVERIIKGRPITRISDDPKDLTPLTPNHLLLLRSGPTLPSGLFVKQDLYRRRWRQVQYMADIFWKRWRSEYLPTLEERQKWLCPKRNFQVGELVLVKHDNSPRPRWPLGLIVDTYPGSDGLVRSVQVKTQSGVYVCPVDKICLLEGEMLQLITDLRPYRHGQIQLHRTINEHLKISRFSHLCIEMHRCGNALGPG
ncbi:hypothetical protein QZH41_013692, partial [Actinostola sp. cb2023]